MPNQIDPLTQILIQRALANPPALPNSKPVLPTHAPIIPPAMNEDIYTHPNETGREWFLRKSYGISNPVELDHLYRISLGGGKDPRIGSQSVPDDPRNLPAVGAGDF